MILGKRFAEHFTCVAAPRARALFAAHKCLRRTKRKKSLSGVPVISIVDDDASVRLATNRLVRSLGYVAHEFASADEFLQSGEAGETSCLIADVQMPGMSGLDLQRRLTADGHRLPIIFVTAFANENVRARALKAGAIGVLSKPFDGSALIKHLDAALKERRETAHK
jgi:FixJ family two-component response regulator